jgi:hypothetical protein
MRGVVSPTVSVSSFLPSSSLPFEGASVERFSLARVDDFGPSACKTDPTRSMGKSYNPRYCGSVNKVSTEFCKI